MDNMIFHIILICIVMVSSVSGFHVRPTLPEPLPYVGFEASRDEEQTEFAKRGSGASLSPERAEEGLRRLIYEVLHCMRPCLNNGMMILPRNAVEVCRCVCPPSHFGLVCEYEFSDKATAQRRRLN